MQDIRHILYNTVGNDFTKYLQTKDILTLSNVSKAFNEEEITSRFKELLIATMKEYEIFKKNNAIISWNESQSDIKIERSLNNFLKYIPLGVIYKNYKLQSGEVIDLLMDHIDAGNDTRLYVWMELCTLEDLNEYLNGWEDIGAWGILRMITQASARNRPDLVEALFIEFKKHWNIEDYDYGEYYSGSKELRDLFIKYRSDVISDLVDRRLFRTPEYYAISYDRSKLGYNEEDSKYGTKDEILNMEETNTFLRIFLFYATSFQEQDTFKQFYFEHRKHMSETIQRILDDESLKYNIDIYNEKLFINNDY